MSQQVEAVAVLAAPAPSANRIIKGYRSRADNYFKAQGIALDDATAFEVSRSGGKITIRILVRAITDDRDLLLGSVIDVCYLIPGVDSAGFEWIEDVHLGESGI